MKEFFKKIFTKENLKKFFRTYIWLMVLLFVVDIVTKWVVFNHYGAALMRQSVHSDDPEVITIIKNFVYIGGSLNQGAAFSFLYGQRVLLLLISLIMSGAFIAFYIIKYKSLTTIYKVALALMITGGVGNLIDRAFYWPSITGFAGVIDWIIFKFGPSGGEFAMFNIADSCLVIGVIIVFIAIVIDEIKQSKKRREKGEYKYSPEQLKAKEKAENEANKSE